MLYVEPEMEIVEFDESILTDDLTKASSTDNIGGGSGGSSEGLPI